MASAESTRPSCAIVIQDQVKIQLGARHGIESVQEIAERDSAIPVKP
jgi:hypothetical protein